MLLRSPGIIAISIACASAASTRSAASGVEAEDILFERVQRDRMSHSPEDRPAGEADLQIVSEVEVGFLPVVPGPCRVCMTRKFAQHDIESVCSQRRQKWQRMWTCRNRPQAIGRLGVTGEGERAHGRGSPVKFLLAEGEGVACKCHAGIQLDRPLPVICSLREHRRNERIVGLYPVKRVFELSDGGGVRWIAGAMLHLLPVVEEEPAMVSAQGESGDGAAASTQRAAKVVPPCLTEVEAVRKGRTCNRSIARIDRFQRQRLIGNRFVCQFVVKIGHQAVRFGQQACAVVILSVGQLLCLSELAQALLPGPWPNGDALSGIRPIAASRSSAG